MVWLSRNMSNWFINWVYEHHNKKERGRLIWQIMEQKQVKEA